MYIITWNGIDQVTYYGQAKTLKGVGRQLVRDCIKAGERIISKGVMPSKKTVRVVYEKDNVRHIVTVTEVSA